MSRPLCRHTRWPVFSAPGLIPAELSWHGLAFGAQAELGEPLTTHYELAQCVYAKATVPVHQENKVCLWLGAQVMLEYPREEVRGMYPPLMWCVHAPRRPRAGVVAHSTPSDCRAPRPLLAGDSTP
jgi:hypothetical protein